MDYNIIPKRANRCKECDKIIRSCNKSRLCSHHNRLKGARDKRKKEGCCICGEKCTGKMKIEARKGTLYIFCTFHFNLYQLKSLKEIRKKIKLNKFAVTI